MKLNLNEQGLIPAIAQDEKTGEVLMTAYMSPESLKKTIESGEAWFYSRSRNELWHKGATSGNYIKVHKIIADCENNSLLLKGTPTGPACHTGKPNCYFQEVKKGDVEFVQKPANMVEELFEVVESRKRERPKGSYVVSLLEQGVDRIGKKVIEEAGEAVIAAKNGVREEVIHEVADLWFHSIILLSNAGFTPKDIWQELEKRRK